MLGSVTAAPGQTVSIPGITVRDFYAAGSSTDMTLRVNAFGGTVAMAGPDGKPVAGSGSHALVFGGSLSEVNAALATLTYTARPWMPEGRVLVNVTNSLGEQMTQETFITPPAR